MIRRNARKGHVFGRPGTAYLYRVTWAPTGQLVIDGATASEAAEAMQTTRQGFYQYISEQRRRDARTNKSPRGRKVLYRVEAFYADTGEPVA